MLSKPIANHRHKFTKGRRRGRGRGRGGTSGLERKGGSASSLPDCSGSLGWLHWLKIFFCKSLLRSRVFLG